MNLLNTSAGQGVMAIARYAWPGLALSALVAIAASFIAEHHGGPPFLYALLIGMVFHFITETDRCMVGIELAAKQLVRVGVVLLGTRIVVADVATIGVGGLATLAGAVALSIGFGLLLARMLKLPPTLGLLTGGATGICGISAALAIASALPPSRDTERFTLVTAIGVATLSTMAMICYPILVSLLGLSVAEAGLFLGGSIHDVSQVVGAGFMVSPAVGESSTLAKMFRVALLVPVVLLVAGVLQRHHRLPGRRSPLVALPGFLIGFAVLVLINSMGGISNGVVELCSEISRWCLLISIAALGIKTSLQKICALGWRPCALLIAEAAFIVMYMLAAIYLGRLLS